MSLIGYRVRKGSLPDMDYWYTLNYSNGPRADPSTYQGDLDMLRTKASELSKLKKREVHIRKNWAQGNDTHYMTISSYENGRKLW